MALDSSDYRKISNIQDEVEDIHKTNKQILNEMKEIKGMFRMLLESKNIIKNTNGEIL